MPGQPATQENACKPEASIRVGVCNTGIPRRRLLLPLIKTSLLTCCTSQRRCLSYVNGSITIFVVDLNKLTWNKGRHLQ